MSPGRASDGGARAGSFGDILVRIAGERPNLLIVSGEDPGPATWFAEIWPERVLTVPPLPTRAAIAEGIVLGGGDAIVVLDAEVADLPVMADAGIVMVSETPAHLPLAHRAGIDVCQPGWIEDLPALVVGALGSATTVLLFLIDHPVTAGAAPSPTSFGEQRVLHRGGAGLVLGAGATAPLARQVAEVLANRQIEVTAMDLHTVTAASRVDPALLQTHLLVGPLDTPRAAALAEVAVGDGDMTALADRVASVLAERR